MPRLAAGLAVLFLFTLPGSPELASEEAAPGLRSLVQAELAFARASMDRGIRRAFLEFLAPEAVVFRPKPIPGRPVYEAMAPVSKASLNWRPAYAEISASGDLGYTTGPYEFRGDKADPATERFGHYVTVWKKQADDAWKALVDAGVAHGRPPDPGDIVFGPSGREDSPGAMTPSEAERETSALLGLDKNMARPAGGSSLLAAYLASSTEDVRIYREGFYPAVGREDASKLLSAPVEFMAWDAQGSGLAASGDLAYTYGTGRLIRAGGKTEKGFSYLRLWRKRTGEAAWLMSLEVLVEHGQD